MSRERLPVERNSVTHKIALGGYEGYVTAGMYDDGRLGEVFFQGFGKEGSFVQSVLGAWGTTLSLALQQGVPIDDLATKWVGVREEPAATGHPDIPVAYSIPDYVGCWLVLKFGSPRARELVGAQLERRALYGQEAAA